MNTYRIFYEEDLAIEGLTEIEAEFFRIGEDDWGGEFITFYAFDNNQEVETVAIVPKSRVVAVKMI